MCEVKSLPPDSQSEAVEDDEVINPYPITFPVRKISMPLGFHCEAKKMENKKGEYLGDHTRVPETP